MANTCNRRGELRCGAPCPMTVTLLEALSPYFDSSAKRPSESANAITRAERELALSLGHWGNPGIFAKTGPGCLCSPASFVTLTGTGDTDVRVLGPTDVARRCSLPMSCIREAWRSAARRIGYWAMGKPPARAGVSEVSARRFGDDLPENPGNSDFPGCPCARLDGPIGARK